LNPNMGTNFTTRAPQWYSVSKSRIVVLIL